VLVPASPIAVGLLAAKRQVEILGPPKIWGPVRPVRPHSRPPGPESKHEMKFDILQFDYVSTIITYLTV
jgi:hypothetical protein